MINIPCAKPKNRKLFVVATFDWTIDKHLPIYVTTYSIG